jgi:hypothetical protein
MNEFGWSLIGSAVVGGGITMVANGHFGQHWNFLIVSAIVFVIYWLVRLGFGDDIDFDLSDVNPFD